MSETLWKGLISSHIGRHLEMIICFSRWEALLTWTSGEPSTVSLHLKVRLKGWLPSGLTASGPAKSLFLCRRWHSQANPPVSNTTHLWPSGGATTERNCFGSSSDHGRCSNQTSYFTSIWTNRLLKMPEQPKGMNIAGHRMSVSSLRCLPLIN